MEIIIIWFVLCNLSIIISVFIHECIHGFISSLNGEAVSTGFNRVGNIYKFPKDKDFRNNFNPPEKNNFWDFAPQFNLLLAIIFTAVFYFKTYMGSAADYIILAFALGNSVIRLIPMVFALITRHTEDEISQGEILVKISGKRILKYVPAVFSIMVSIACIVFIYMEIYKYGAAGMTIYNLLWIFPSFILSFVILNVLDNHFRINWQARGKL